MIKKGIGSYFTLGEYKEINKEKVKKVDGIIKIGIYRQYLWGILRKRWTILYRYL